jgi:hypothetical protein
LHGHGVGEPSPIAVAPPDSKNELPGDAVTKAKETLSEQFAALGMTFTWEDFAATYPDVADPQTIPEDDGADYPSGNGAPEAHSHPADDKGSRHRHPADSREVHTHVKSKESNHVHVVLIPEKMRWLHPGDRVVVVWVQNQAVVVDIILNATAIG